MSVAVGDGLNPYVAQSVFGSFAVPLFHAANIFLLTTSSGERDRNGILTVKDLQITDPPKYHVGSSSACFAGSRSSSLVDNVHHRAVLGDKYLIKH